MLNHGLSYKIDIVFCLDTASRCAPTRDLLIVLDQNFPADLVANMEKRGKATSEIRMRLITFGHQQYENSANHSSDFVKVHPRPGGMGNPINLPQSQSTSCEGQVSFALDALSCAIRSNWTQDGDRRRHIVVMVIDPTADALEEQDLEALADLTDLWQGNLRVLDHQFSINQSFRRLVLMAPDLLPWSAIGDEWEQTIYLPYESAITDQTDLRQLLLEILCNSV